MSMELIALIGIGVTVITIGVALAALILNTQRNLRADMRTEFKAVRAEIQAQRDETKTEFKAVRADMQAQREETKAEFKAQREETKTEFKAVRADMQAQRDETKTEFKAQREVIISLLERMAHLEGLLEGLREAITGRRVAEDAGKYDPR